MSIRATLHIEIEEDIINQLVDHFASLRNCALTCRAWVPRSRSLFLRAVRIATRSASDGVFDYFQEKPHMRPLVRSLATAPTPTERTQLLGTYPASLIRMLPNLRRWELRAPLVDAKNVNDPPKVFFHRTTLIQLRCSPITELHVSSIHFPSQGEFVRLISSIPLLRVLECTEIQLARGKGIPLTMGPPLPRRPLVNLSTVQVCQQKEADEEGVISCLLELTKSSLQNLILRQRKSFKWSAATPFMSQLRSLTLHVDQREDGLSTLLSETFGESLSWVRGLQCRSALERLEIHIHLSDAAGDAWDRARCNDPVSRWIASGSRDLAIIWDARTRRPMHEWIVPMDHLPSADAFTFSSDSKRLACCACAKGRPFVQIRDVDGGRKLTVLQGREFDDDGAGALSQFMCAWLPDRLIFVSLARSTVVVRTWDGHTFRQQSTWQTVTPFEHGSLLLSPDGRRLAGLAIAAATGRKSRPVDHPRPRPTSRQRPRRPANRPRPYPTSRPRPSLVNYPLCVLWDLGTGRPGQVLPNVRDGEQVLAASFDHESERLALSLADHTVRIWNTTTRELLSMAEPNTVEERGSEPYRHHLYFQTYFQMSPEVLSKAVAFSPDGRHLLSLSLRHMRGCEDRLDTLLMAWDALSGRPTPPLRCDDTLPSAVCRNSGLARFSPTGTHVAFAGNDGKVHVIDLSSGLLLRTRTFGGPEAHMPTRFGMHSDYHAVTRLVFSPDGHTLCWANRGGAVEIHSL